MTNPLKYLVRRLALRKNRSEVPQGIVPLGALNSAAVFIDRQSAGASEAEQAVRKFFGERNIELTLLSPDAAQLNYAGYMRRRFRLPEGRPRAEELFVSLSCRPDDFASEFEARCSPAKFKVGCLPLRGGVYDLTVSPPEGMQADQPAVFRAITEYLLKIK